MTSKLVKAFNELRRIGFVAKHNFKCCQNCGWEACVKEANLGLCIGIVFYHQQDNGKKKAGKDFYLCFGYPHAETPLKDQLVGYIVLETLMRYGIKVDWNGNTNRRIKILGGTWK